MANSNTNSANFGSSNTNKDLTRAGNLGISHQNHTFSFWVKLNSEISSGTYTLFNLSTNLNSHYINWIVAYNYNSGSQTLQFTRQREGVGSDFIIYSSGALGTSKWYLITMKCTTGSGGVLTGYVNGVSVGTAATNGDGIIGSDLGNHFALGSSTTPNSFSSVQIDDVRVWNAVRSDTDISNDYTGPTELFGTETNLLAYYTFDTSLTTDLTSNGNTLTNNNSVAQSTDIPFVGASGFIGFLL